MTRHFGRRVGFLALGVFALVGVTRFHMRQRRQAEQLRPYGRFTAAQIHAGSETLCRLVDAQPDSLWHSSARMETYRRDRAIRRFWDADCTDADGNVIVHLTWNADTGDLIFVGHYRRPEPRLGLAPMDRREAIRQARDWMLRLGMTHTAPRWRLDEVSNGTFGMWRVRWRAGEQAVVIRMDAQSRELAGAQLWQFASAMQSVSR